MWGTDVFDMGSIIAKTAILDFGIQWTCFAVAAALKTEKFYDLAGSATFLLATYKSLEWGRTWFPRQKIQSAMVITWAVRLGLFLFSRVMKDGFDRRFTQAKVDPKKFFIFWTIQGVWVLVTLLPTLILNSQKQDKAVGTRDYVGWALWGTGFLFEVLADYQKSQFRANPDNAGRFISSGLWGISRHPNYLGEILLWSGLFVSASSVMRGKELLSVLSPMFVALLLTKVSGIPLLEKSSMRRWGQEAAYQDYLKNTAVLIPYIW